jgi:hypothetical protein
MELPRVNKKSKAVVPICGSGTGCAPFDDLLVLGQQSRFRLIDTHDGITKLHLHWVGASIEMGVLSCF